MLETVLSMMNKPGEHLANGAAVRIMYFPETEVYSSTTEVVPLLQVLAANCSEQERLNKT